MNRWYARIPWLTLLGSACLFFSWVLENYFQNEWAARKQYLFETRVLIGIEAGLIDLWTLRREDENRRKPTDSDLIAAADYKLVNHLSNAIATLVYRNYPDEPNVQELIDACREAKQTSRVFYKDKNYDALANKARTLQNLASKIAPKELEEHERQYSEVAHLESTWRSRFLALYIVGSVILAFGFVWGKLKGTQRNSAQTNGNV